MRAENRPPSRKSTLLCVVCQSSEAAFHCLMSSGLFHAAHTASRLAFTTVSTVIFMDVLSLSGGLAGVGLVAAFARRRKLAQLVGRAPRPRHQLAAAVPAAPAQDALPAPAAERAFERADQRLGGLGRQVGVAALTARA